MDYTMFSQSVFHTINRHHQAELPQKTRAVEVVDVHPSCFIIATPLNQNSTPSPHGPRTLRTSLMHFNSFSSPSSSRNHQVCPRRRSRTWSTAYNPPTAWQSNTHTYNNNSQRNTPKARFHHHNLHEHLWHVFWKSQSHHIITHTITPWFPQIPSSHACRKVQNPNQEQNVCFASFQKGQTWL